MSTNDKQKKKFYLNLYFLFIICRIIKFFFLIILKAAKAGVSDKNPSKTYSNVELFFIISQNFFLELNFSTEIKTMLLKQSAVKKYCVYYVFEHFKYCTQIMLKQSAVKKILRILCV